MDFTSTTELARKGSKTFSEYNYATVLHNNKDIGMVVGGALYQKIKDSQYFDDIIEDIEMEMNSEVLEKRWSEALSEGGTGVFL